MTAGSTIAAPREIPGPANGPLHAFRYPAFVAFELLVFFAIWQVAQDVFAFANPVFLPTPLRILDTLIAMFLDGTMVSAIETSAAHWLGGYGTALCVGVSAGLLMGTSRPFRKLVSPLAWSLYSTPYIWIQPMLVIWFGFGSLPVMGLVFYAALMPIMLTTAAGAATVNEDVLRAATVYGIRGISLRRKVTIPATLPFITTGMRLAVPTSLIAVLVGEFLGGSAGLGRQLALSANTFRVDQIFSVIIVLVVISTSMIVVFGLLERRFAPWRTNQAGQE